MTHRLLAIAPASFLLFTACVQPVEEEPVAASPAALTQQTVSALAVVGQVSQTFESLSDEQAPAEVMRADGMEPAPVENPNAPGCSTIQWTILDPLRITVFFDGCTTPAGESLDGSVTGWLNYDGVDGAIGIALDDLTVGDLRVDGFLVIATDGPQASTIETDVSLIDPEGNVRISLDARLSTAGGVLQLDGSGAFEQNGDRWSADAAAVRWEDPAECYPTAGSLDIAATGLPPITVVFSATSMQIQVGGLPPVNEPFPTCPGA